jgi:hypothetical protein
VAARPPRRLAAFAVLALVVAWPLLSTASAMNEFRDAHVLAHYESVARDTILRWHQAPLWDPYYCGGMYLLGTPQARFVSPSFLLTLLFGEPRGEALTAFAMLIVGLEGAFLYARSRGATAFASLVTAPVFALSGIFAMAPALGWVNFFGFELLPWIALGIRRAFARDVRGALVAAVAMAWCIGFGGTYAAPLAVVWCSFELAEGVLRNVRRRPAGVALGLGFAGAAALMAVGLAAARLWPVAETLSEARRVIGGTPANSVLALTRMAGLPAAHDSDDGAFFVGSLVAPALLFGLTLRRSWFLAFAGVLCVWLAMGFAAHPSLFGALRELPFFGVLRYPERFLVPCAIAASAIAAQGVARAECWARSRRAKGSPGRTAARFALVVTAAAALANLGPQVSLHWARANGRSLSAAPERVDGPFRQARGNRWALGYYEPMQRGSLSCWEAYPVAQSPLLRGDAASEESILEPRTGSVTERAWSPNAIDLDVELSRPATVVINQNWHSGWRSSAGEVKSEGGRLAVALGPGTHRIELRFAPWSATGGAWVSIAAIAATVFAARRARRQARAGDLRDLAVIAALAAAPLLLGVLTWAAIRETRIAPAPVTPDGRPVIADGLDEGAVRLDARLADDVVIEAASLSEPDPIAGQDVMLEIDWRRGARVPRGVGVFVHLEPSSGDSMNGDHALLSSVLDLEDAPVDKTLRDVIPVRLPDDARGKTWKVWVGLWFLRGNGGRVPVVDSGHAIVVADRVLVSQFVAR